MVLLALALAVAPAFAPMPPGASAPYWRGIVPVAGETLKPLEQVYRDLGKRYKGKALDATTLRPGPGTVLYEVQFLTNDGRKLVITVNARDGGVVAMRGAH
jgi:uncharacterized membrane protein YkoI